jgi:hypothetical protein
MYEAVGPQYGETMNNPSLIKGNVNPSTTIDFTTGLGYGLIFQPVIGSSASPVYPCPKQFFLSHRRKFRRIPEMRRK